MSLIQLVISGHTQTWANIYSFNFQVANKQQEAQKRFRTLQFRLLGQ